MNDNHEVSEADENKEKRKDQRRKNKRRKSDRKSMSNVREWFIGLIPVLVLLVSGVVVFIEWRGATEQKIEQLKSSQAMMKASLTRQIKQLREALSRQIEDKAHHVVLNRQYMEKNREHINGLQRQMSKFEGIFYDSRDIFGAIQPPRPHTQSSNTTLIKRQKGLH